MVTYAEDPDERIPEGAIVLDEAVVDQFAIPEVDEVFTLENFPVTSSQVATIEVTRRELYDPASQIEVLVTDEEGNSAQMTMEPSGRKFFRAVSVAGYDSRLAFVLDEQGLLIGHSQVAEGVFLVAGVESTEEQTSRSQNGAQKRGATDTDRTAATPLGSRKSDAQPQTTAAHKTGFGVPGLLPPLLSSVEPYECEVRAQEPLLDGTSRRPVEAPEAARAGTKALPDDLPTAVLAFDTDNTFLARKFGDVPLLARNWIEEAVNHINVSLELDLGLRILVGDIILRGGVDPYENSDQRASEGALNEFAQHWVAHENHRERTFAMLLSGNSVQADFATGIAAVNSSCQMNRGYSVTQVYVADVDVTNDARLILHEVGHMLGTHHTHCYSPTVDSCFNQEAGCHNGPVVCPTSGRGSAMSLCNISGCNRPNVDGFSPRISSVLREKITSDPACFVRSLFRDGFEGGDTVRWSN